MSAAKPGTALPWAIDTDTGPCVIANLGTRGIAECYEDGETQDETDVQNAAYIVTACNAYPQLVAALRATVEELTHHEGDALTNQRRADGIALLRSLGEVE